MAADPDHVFTIPDNDFFGLGPAEYAGEAYQQGLVKAAGIGGLFARRGTHTVQFQKKRTQKPAPRPPCTFLATDGSIQPWLTCYVCSQSFSPASVQIHEPQCLKKHQARARRMDPMPRRPRVTANMQVVEYNCAAFEVYDKCANPACPNCGKTYSTEKIEKHIASCKEFSAADAALDLITDVVKGGKQEEDTEEVIKEAMTIWRKTHPPPRQGAEPMPEPTAHNINETLYRDWLEGLRGYEHLFQELRPGEDRAAAVERHVDYLNYRSTVIEHLDGTPVSSAMAKRTQERRQPMPIDVDLRRAMRPSGPAKRWRPHTAPRAFGGDIWCGQSYDPHEQGTREARPFDTKSFDGVLRNTQPQRRPLGLQVSGSMVASAAASAEALAEDGAPPPLAAAVRIEHARLESKHPKQQTAAAQLAQMEQAGESFVGLGGSWSGERAALKAAGQPQSAPSTPPVEPEPPSLWTGKHPVAAKRAGGGALDPPGPRWGTRAPAKKDGKHRFAKVVPRPPPAPDPALGDCITTIPLSMQRHVDAAFGIGDNRSRGALDLAALQRLMAAAGFDVTAEQAEAMMQQADLDGSGQLSFQEFARVLRIC